MKTRLIAKLEIKDENVVKPIYFEGLKKIPNIINIRSLGLLFAFDFETRKQRDNFINKL